MDAHPVWLRLRGTLRPVHQDLIDFETLCDVCGQKVLRRASHQGGAVFELNPDSKGVRQRHNCPGPPMLGMPEDIAFALEQKRQYFWQLRGNLKTGSSFSTHDKTKSLSGERRKRGVLQGFVSYREQLEPLLDEAVAAFVQLISRVENLGFQNKIALVRNNVQDCFIQPTVERDSIARWLAEACLGCPSLEELRVLHEDTDNWIAPKWLTPSRIKVKKRGRGWVLVVGSKSTRITKRFAQEHLRRGKNIPVNLSTIHLINDLESTLSVFLEGVLDRAIARCIQNLLPTAVTSPAGKRTSPLQTNPGTLEPSSRQSNLRQKPVEPSSLGNSEMQASKQFQLITDRTYFILDAAALAHSEDKLGELVAAYAIHDVYRGDASLVCVASSSAELAEELRSIRADHKKLLIHWDKSKQALDEVPNLLKAYLSLQETAKTVRVKQVDDAVGLLRSFFQHQGKKRGRPRQDALRKRVQTLRNEGLSWGKIQRKLNQETGTKKTIGAYRNLVTARHRIPRI